MLLLNSTGKLGQKIVQCNAHVTFYLEFSAIFKAILKNICRRKDCVNILLSTDVLVLLGVAGHLPDANSILDVFELQAQVLASDGQHGSSLPWPRLRKQLLVKEKDPFSVSKDVQCGKPTKHLPP